MKEYYFYRCVKCGRKLRTPESQQRGMGKTCYEKYCKDMEQYNKELSADTNVHKVEFKKFRLFEVK